MQSRFTNLKALVWFTQFAISVVGPLVIFILAAVWLRDRFSLGGWVVTAGVILGLLGAVSGFRNSLKTMDRVGKETDQEVPPSFNEHK